MAQRFGGAKASLGSRRALQGDPVLRDRGLLEARFGRNAYGPSGKLTLLPNRFNDACGDRGWIISEVMNFELAAARKFSS